MTRDFIPPSRDLTFGIAAVTDEMRETERKQQHHQPEAGTSGTGTTGPKPYKTRVLPESPSFCLPYLPQDPRSGFGEKAVYNKIGIKRYRHSTSGLRFRHKTDVTDCNVCWYCTEPISDPKKAVAAPRCYYPATQTYITEGIFCGWGCMTTFAYERYHPMDSFEVCRNAQQIRRKLCPKSLTCPRAPHWSCLKKFGGYMSIDEFRAAADSEDIETTGSSIPYILPAGSKVVLGGSRFFETAGVVEAAQSDSDLAQVKVNRQVRSQRKTVSTYVPKAPLINSAQYQRDIKKEEIKHNWTQHKTTKANNTSRMQQLLGATVKKPKK